MRLTSHERVLTAFAHEEPDRVPAWCGASDEFWHKAKAELGLDDEGLLRFFGDDFRRVRAGYAGPKFALEHDNATYRTVFGIEREGLGYGQPIGHPLAGASLDAIHDYPWPDPAWACVDGVREVARAWNGEYAILGGDWSPFWHDAIDLVGMEELMTRMCVDPESVDALLGHIVDYYFAASARIFEVAGDVIDIFFFGNDLGTQRGPFVSEALYRRFVEPHLARLARLGHDFGLKVMMHCCGGVAELIPMFIDAGIDALHAVQPSCRGMDLRALKAQFGDAMVFNGAIDSHHVLINGTPESVRRATRDVLDVMKPGGGYIAGASHDTILEETPVENVIAMFETIREYGIYA
ncbi:MAG TPA: uroporphyrinogen decarboxylase family protein [Candidatus Hydrogenedentes bacterium]|nr:uroporphyrinogen decarboxylase family protein [Candidatus Hydrogenedentota bacterium]HPG69892.1 uroporphyrinogen decarboxylase family protein [Candidatus Hydrogenedentota bacterium]